MRMCTSGGSGRFIFPASAVTDVWAALDGRLNAPTGSPQYPNLLDGYATRPPWYVAGVDYAVGPDSTTVFKDPNIDGVPANCDIGPSWRVNVNGANVTLENYDIGPTQATSAIYFWNGANNCVVRNCKIGFVQNQSGEVISNLLFDKCIFDLTGLTDADWQAAFFDSPNGVTFRYCHFKNACSDFVQFNSSVTDPLFEYCLFDTAGVQAGKHPDYTQFLGGVAGTNGFRLRFCTSRQGAAASGSQGFMCELNAGTISGGEYAYNTFTPGSGQPNYFTGVTLSQLVGVFATHHNYYDESGATVFAKGGGTDGAPGDGDANTTYYSNVDMVTGLPGNND